MRQIIIGDIHGCFDELVTLLEKVKFNKEEDELIFLGDLINKGPYSVKVLEFVKGNGYRSILGNHEMGFLRALDNDKYMKGGFLKIKNELGAQLDEYAQWIRELPLYIEEKDFIAIHGGLEPGVELQKQRPEIATRIRTWDGTGEDMNDFNNPAWYELYKDKKLVVFGHWAARGLIIRDNAIGLDTGCVWGGELSALILPAREVISVPAQKMYRDPNS